MMLFKHDKNVSLVTVSLLGAMLFLGGCQNKSALGPEANSGQTGNKTSQQATLKKKTKQRHSKGETDHKESAAETSDGKEATDDIAARISKKYERVYGNERQQQADQQNTNQDNQSEQLPDGYGRTSNGALIYSADSELVLNGQETVLRIINHSQKFADLIQPKDQDPKFSVEDYVEESEMTHFRVVDANDGSYYIATYIYANGNMTVQMFTLDPDGTEQEYLAGELQNENWFNEGLYRASE
ncbi:hypothetical protein [Lapidilactobacillus luobeiensis]|uniref:hypothetical protein n=1 Tax=Lapidilactobacillus luobeiensis TaxID=2950371 RepID=UPI0021C29032|nr:hypothetical protein [Lapidilactobacillus luobeiensis]